MKKTLFIVLGFLSFFLGTVGIFLPLLPTVPFYLLTGYLWFNSSERLHRYLVNSKYYQKYIHQTLVEKKVTPKQLAKMLLAVFIMLSIPFILIDSLHVRIILIIVFIAHIIGGYFYFIRKPTKSR
ncbi:YbaN family protein [Orbus sasakiae]|uniref:Inner membrane protein n=1 Tax=Orbus sasakiae TaxID=1078475 RepID=A0ABP9N4Q5_9GAMM